MTWHTRNSGSLLARIRKHLFGLNFQEQADNWRRIRQMNAELARKNAQEDELFDKWWERFPERRDDLDHFEKYYERAIAREDWLAKKHAVINSMDAPFAHEFSVVREVEITEQAKRAVREFDLDVYINTAATEPRWECWGQHVSERAFGEDPNETIMRCVGVICDRRGQHPPKPPPHSATV